MKELLIGDLHFGIKSNSINWLESQLNLFRNQIFKIIEDEELDRIVFLGDLFDIRYSLQQEVGYEVKNIIRELVSRFDKPIIFVAGNHDYYSPLEEYSCYNCYDMLFGEEFVKAYPNLIFVTQTPYLTEDGGLFLPWYWTENDAHFSELLYNYKFGVDVKSIYCHVDLNRWPGARITSLKGCPIYAGHIHYIYEDKTLNLYNIGAALPLTFGDVNSDRYLYILEDHTIIKKIPNTTTPKFTRIYNEQIFSVSEEIFDNSYVELCISNSNINKARYIDQIKLLKTTYINSSIKLHLMDDNDTIESLNSYDGLKTNINQYIEDNIPDYLVNKYKYIKNKIQNVES